MSCRILTCGVPLQRSRADTCLLWPEAWCPAACTQPGLLVAAFTFTVLQAWAEARALPSERSSCGGSALQLQQQVFHAWRGWFFLQGQQRQLQRLHQQHMLRSAWQLWVQHGPKMQAQHAAASAAFTALGSKLLQQWGLQAFVEQLQEQQARQHLQQQKLSLLLGRWKQLAAAAARKERLLTSRQVARLQRQLHRCFMCWWHQTAAAGRHAVGKHAAALQVRGSDIPDMSTTNGDHVAFTNCGHKL